ncbi:alpha/beta hydrolase family protein [Paenibacillus piri]|uniref:Alpha/beta hydrolase n=1 Tax=Paenibacillus piri TaxID=2547395 RepID=A0A4R5KT22_9BACL|nr:alpha/beta hydrolase [Paenibacillus piri]TDF98786.1 alpha/beta hydrolase [Paenibacillus piri]
MGVSTITSKAFTIELAGGGVINGEVKTVEDGVRKPVLLLSHGFRGFKDWGFWPYASASFARQHYYVVTFDFSRIYIKNGDFDEAAKLEAFTVSNELSDLDALLRHIREQALPLAELSDPSRIALLGHSRAGSSSIIFASEHPEVGAIVALNASAHLTPQGEGRQEAVIAADLERTPERYAIPHKLAAYRGDALIIQGDVDAERLLAGNQALRAAAPDQTFVTIPGGDHTFGISHPFLDATPALSQALEAASSFLAKWRNHQ